MQIRSREQILRVMRITRFHFIAGLPYAGGRLIASLLRQNPRFHVREDHRARPVFELLGEELAPGGRLDRVLDAEQALALRRAALDAVAHDRDIDTVVIDRDDGWLAHVEELVALYPLARFIVPVRNPAAIAAAMRARTDSDEAEAPGEPAGQLAAIERRLDEQLARMRAVLAAPASERVLLVDYDRLIDEPQLVMDVIHDFLREEPVQHDLETVGLLGALGDEEPGLLEPAAPPLPSAQLVRRFSGRAFWRGLRRTRATMLLADHGERRRA